jgi:hypothetical protein
MFSAWHRGAQAGGDAIRTGDVAGRGQIDIARGD